jgi:hypothetical protein
MAEPVTLSDGFNYDRAALEMCAPTGACIPCAIQLLQLFHALTQQGSFCLLCTLSPSGCCSRDGAAGVAKCNFKSSYVDLMACRWLLGHDTSPMTGAQLEANSRPLPNFALRSAIGDWRQQGTAAL